MKKIVILFIITLLIMSFKVISAEEKADELNDYEIQRVTEKVKDFAEPVVKKNNFVNIETGDIEKTIDLLEDNPFSNLPFEKEIIDKGNVPFYSYPGLMLKDIFDDFSWIYPPLYNTHKDEILWRSDVSTIREVKPDFVTLAYFITAYRNPEILLGVKSSFFIYNKKGEEVFRLENLRDGLSAFVTTDDCKYLGYLHGQQIEEYPRVFIENPGLKIYDTETGGLILSKVVPFNVKLINILSKNNIIVYNTRVDSGVERKYFIHYVIPEKRIIYSATLANEISNRIKHYSDEGLILGKTCREDDETELFSFEKNFQKEEF